MNKFILISNPTNIYYLTGFKCTHTRDAFTISTPKSKYLVTNSMYAEQVQELDLVRNKAVEIKVMHVDYRLSDIIREILDADETLYFEADDLTVQEYESVKSKLNIKLEPIKNEIKKQRQIKSEDEIEKISKAVDITRKSINELKEFIIANRNSGITELDCVEKLRQISLKLGGEGFGFDPIIAFASNSSKPHHSPGKTRLKPNAVVLLDIGIKYQEYSGDLTETFCLEDANEEFNKIYKIVDDCRKVCIEAIKHDVTFKSIHKLAVEYFKQFSLDQYFIHSIGHGLGLDIHEEPHVSDTKLEPGMVITIEPGIYLPGNFGVRIENDVLVMREGYRII